MVDLSSAGMPFATNAAKQGQIMGAERYVDTTSTHGSGYYNPVDSHGIPLASHVVQQASCRAGDGTDNPDQPFGSAGSRYIGSSAPIAVHGVHVVDGFSGPMSPSSVATGSTSAGSLDTHSDSKQQKKKRKRRGRRGKKKRSTSGTVSSGSDASSLKRGRGDSIDPQTSQTWDQSGPSAHVQQLASAAGVPASSSGQTSFVSTGQASDGLPGHASDPVALSALSAAVSSAAHPQQQQQPGAPYPHPVTVMQGQLPPGTVILLPAAQGGHSTAGTSASVGGGAHAGGPQY